MRRARGGRRSIRARLTIATTFVAAVVLSLLAVVTAMQLQNVASTAATQLAVDDLRPYAADLRSQPGERPDLPASGLLVLVVGPDGTVRRSSMPAALARAAHTVDGAGDVMVAGDAFRVVARTVTNASGAWRLWAARDRTATDELQRGVLLTALIGTPVAVLLTAVIAWLVAGAALRPVGRMRTSAERLRSPGATGALPTRGADELADLGTTLNTLIADLRAAAAHERRVTADAAHELRTPLAVLAAQIELAQRRPADADLSAIRVSVDRMSTLADDLLTLARAESVPGGRTVDTAVADLVTEAMDTVDRSRLLAPDGVLVDLELEDGLDERATAAIDVSGFGRIVTNLVGNALAATPSSSVVVRVRSDARSLVLDVEDDGTGVPSEFLPVAFDRFSRPEGTRSAGSSGSGLGLALVLRLAEVSGGSVTLGNREGIGALATVRLPLRPPSTD